MDRESTAIPLSPARRSSWTLRLAGLAAAGPPAALTRVQLAVLCTTFAVAVALRLYGLADWPLEQDEVFTYFRSYELDRLNARPFYFLIQRALLELLPHSEFYLRLPALAFGLAGVWATWALGRRTFGITAGLVAAFLVAISPWHIYASQFARYWSLVYLLAVILYGLLPRAIDADRPRPYLAALAIIILGVLSHPTFAFPLIGFVLGLHRVRRSGAVEWHAPSRRAWRLLWGPLAAIGVAGFGALAATGNLVVFRNGYSRGLLVTLRLAPAMAQWVGPVVAAAAIASGAWLAATRPADRRWAAAALLGGATCTTILLLASLVTSVYTDYGLSMLPLAFVTIGGAVQRLGAALEGADARIVPGAAVAVLATGVLPGTISHLSDGTRHDARPAYAYIEAERARGHDAPVYGSALELQRFYAPGLPFIELRRDSARLADALRESGGFWLIGFYRREGMVLASEAIEAWTRAHCHSVLQTARPRLDYRIYRVELHWCGHEQTAAGMAVR